MHGLLLTTSASSKQEDGQATVPAAATSIPQTEVQSRWYAAPYLMHTTVSANSAGSSHWLELGSQVALGVRRERIPPCIDQIDSAGDWVMSGLGSRFSLTMHVCTIATT